MLKAIKSAFAAVSGGAPTQEKDQERFFQAVERDDAPTLRKIAARNPGCANWVCANGAALAVAITHRSRYAFDALVALGANLNEGGNAGPPLHLAVKKGDAGFARSLLKAGADPGVSTWEVSDKKYLTVISHPTPLSIAIQGNDKAMIVLLADNGADLKAACYTSNATGPLARATPAEYAALKQPALAGFIASLVDARRVSAPVMSIQAPIRVRAPLTFKK